MANKLPPHSNLRSEWQNYRERIVEPGEYLATPLRFQSGFTKVKGTEYLDLFFGLEDGKEVVRRYWVKENQMDRMFRELGKIGIANPDDIERGFTDPILTRITVKHDEEGFTGFETIVSRFEVVEDGLGDAQATPVNSPLVVEAVAPVMPKEKKPDPNGVIGWSDEDFAEMDNDLSIQ